MRFKVGHSCYINYCRSNQQICSFCGRNIGKHNYAYSLRKKCDISSYNVWIHFKCLDKFYKELKEVYKEAKDKILVEEI